MNIISSYCQNTKHWPVYLNADFLKTNTFCAKKKPCEDRRRIKNFLYVLTVIYLLRLEFTESPFDDTSQQKPPLRLTEPEKCMDKRMMMNRAQTSDWSSGDCSSILKHRRYLNRGVYTWTVEGISLRDIYLNREDYLTVRYIPQTWRVSQWEVYAVGTSVVGS